MSALASSRVDAARAEIAADLEAERRRVRTAEYDRAWDDGYRRGVESTLMATLYEDAAADIMRVCGVPIATARAIMQQAAHDLRIERPELPEIARRALAARRVERLILRRIRRENCEA